MITMDHPPVCPGLRSGSQPRRQVVISIIVNDVETSSKYILDYGTDQTFSAYQSYIGPTSGTMAMSFTATAAGEVHYFSVYASNSSYYSNNFSI